MDCVKTNHFLYIKKKHQHQQQHFIIIFLTRFEVIKNHNYQQYYFDAETNSS